jgi:acyl-CoA synthetase (AMP-forming)/AMP-acid ligase II
MPLVGVEAAFAAAKPDGNGGKRVIGYVCPLSVDVAVVLDTCRARLVSAAVPTLIVPLERLPMLPNGKVDMKALPDVAPSATEVSPTCCPLSALVLLSTGTSTALGIQ